MSATYWPSGGTGAVGPTGPAGPTGPQGPAGGSFVLLETHTASSSAELDFTAWYSSAYDDYEIRIVNIVPATSGVGFRMQMSSNGGSSYDTGANYTILFNHSYPPSNNISGGTLAQTGLDIPGTIGTVASYTVNGRGQFSNPGGSGYKVVQFTTSNYNSGVSSPINTVSAGWWLNTAAVNAFRFLMSSGNIASGSVRIYGIAKT